MNKSNSVYNDKKYINNKLLTCDTLTHFQANEGQLCIQCPALYDQLAGGTKGVFHAPWDYIVDNAYWSVGIWQCSSCKLYEANKWRNKQGKYKKILINNE